MRSEATPLWSVLQVWAQRSTSRHSRVERWPTRSIRRALVSSVGWHAKCSITALHRAALFYLNGAEPGSALAFLYIAAEKRHAAAQARLPLCLSGALPSSETSESRAQRAECRMKHDAAAIKRTRAEGARKIRIFHPAMGCWPRTSLRSLSARLRPRAGVSLPSGSIQPFSHCTRVVHALGSHFAERRMLTRHLSRYRRERHV